MTLRLLDIGFILVVSCLAGFGGAAAFSRFDNPDHDRPPVVIFNAGKYVVDRIQDQVSTGIGSPETALRESGQFSADLAGRGYIVLNADAVLAAPSGAFVEPYDSTVDAAP